MQPMPLHLVPLVGPFHRRFPRYNAETVREVVERLDPDVVVTSCLSASAFEQPDWRDVDEPGFERVVAWARSDGRTVHALGEASPDPSAAADFVRYLREAGAASDALARVDEAEAPLVELLAGALDLDRIFGELEPRLTELVDVRLEAFGDGPGTDWLEERSDGVAERLRSLEASRAALLVPIDHLPALRRRLGSMLENAPNVPPSETARQRALLDSAFLGRADDAAGMLSALREVEAPEARLAEAETLLRHGHGAEALEVLIEATRHDFFDPPYLPGWLLARLGQLYDLDGRREEAKKAYRGVLALSWAPRPAREAASDGLDQPFRPAAPEGEADREPG